MDDPILISVLVSIAVCVVIAIIFVIIGFVIYYTFKKKNIYKLNTYNETKSLLSNDQLELSRKSHTDEDIVNARIMLRSSNFSLIKPVFDIGRGTKDYYLVKSHDRGDKYIFTVTCSEKDCKIISTEKNRSSFITLLKKIKHPFIFPIEYIDYQSFQKRSLVCRRLSPKGSLKDFMYKTYCLKSHDVKYSTGKALLPKYIARFGRQILEGLKAIKSLGLGFPQLSTANIMLDQSNICQISELELIFLGKKPCHFRNLIRIQNKSESEVICFGHILFELATGTELTASTNITDILNDYSIPYDLNEILHLIFSEKKDSKVTINDLLSKPFFSSVELGIDLPELPLVKLKKSEKELINNVTEYYEYFISKKTDRSFRESVYNKKKPRRDRRMEILKRSTVSTTTTEETNTTNTTNNNNTTTAPVQQPQTNSGNNENSGVPPPPPPPLP